MTKARDLGTAANSANTAISSTELGYLDGVTSSVQTQLDAKVAKALVDAKGDIIVATAADTVSRLGVGSNDTVLTADSTAATGLKWATSSSGSQTTLATGSFSSTSISINSISDTYKDLRLYVYDLTNSSSGGAGFRMTMNNDTSSLYYRLRVVGNGNDFANGSPNINLQAPINTNPEAKMVFNFYDYANTTASKTGDFQMFYDDYSSTSWISLGSFAYKSTTALSSIQLSVASGGFASGTYTLVGIK